jgi:hypothetical protein
MISRLRVTETELIKADGTSFTVKDGGMLIASPTSKPPFEFRMELVGIKGHGLTHNNEIVIIVSPRSYVEDQRLKMFQDKIPIQLGTTFNVDTLVPYDYEYEELE